MRGRRTGGWRAGLFAAAVACGVLLAGLRLFTCIIVLPDDPTSFFALRRHPALASLVCVGDEPLRREYVLLDDDENQLAYEAPYLALAGFAPFGAGACLVLAALVLAWPRRRPGAPPD